MVRFEPDQLAALDAWIAAKELPGDGKLSRPEAIRLILKFVLK